MKEKRQCLRCGTCCKKGGPVLHGKDLSLLDNSVLSLDNLITIRKQEPSFNPFTDRIEPAGQELIKIAGKGASWECIFYDAGQSACLIHTDRPMECRALQCWDTGEIQAISENERLSRFDLIGKNDPLRDFMELHEEQCSYGKALTFLEHLSAPLPNAQSLEGLTLIMRKDLEIRDKAISRFRLSLNLELFYFGRPLFKSLRHPCLRVNLSGPSIHLELIRPA
ncbi:MAG: YkgJ family cysteine cluster protein [Deltaproteobacteria bacterium]|nr:YkgJ family cysteine cluster protein [Deltaproteobacteria bacterium]